MKYLLDTHTFLWTVSNSKNLSKTALEAIQNPLNDIYVSAVTFWEISIKTRIKRLDLDTLKPKELISLAERMDFTMLSLTPEEAISYHELGEDTHHDPFDRMLIWQAISRDIGLISKDQELKKFNPFGLKLLW